MSIAATSEKKSEQHSPTIERLRRVWHLIPRVLRWRLSMAAIIMAMTSAASTAVALLLGSLIDRIQTGSDAAERSQLYVSAGLVLGLLALTYLMRELLNLARRALVESTCTRINQEMQLRTISHTLKIDLNKLGAEKSGTLHGKIFRSVDGLVHFMRVMFLDCLPALLTGLFAFTAALTKQPLVGLFMLGVIPLSLFITFRQLRTQKGVRLQLMRDCEEIDGMVVEQFNGVEYIRVANTYDQEFNRLSDATEARRKREFRHHFEMSFYGFAKAINEAFFHIVVLGLATYLAINGHISYGDVLTISVLYLNVMAPLNEVHRVMDEGHEASLRVDDLFRLLDEPLDESFACEATQRITFTEQEPLIELNQLTVSYRTREGKKKRALDNLDLTIHHGDMIGVAGRSGAGKSTWIKVLLRLLHPEQGEVKLGKTPLGLVGRDELARTIGYVGQNPFVFSGTIHDNIAYGNGAVTGDQVAEAAKLANLHNEILEMPGQYQAHVTERGQNLSGGQRQRIALARILLKQAPLLILDEATSALDNISERHVQRSLGITNADRTTIVIAHRLSTLKDCDTILVFDEGRIAERGTYAELVNQGGIFAELVRSAETGILQPASPPPEPALT
jgi:ATP-binding cassette subfamily B protein